MARKKRKKAEPDLSFFGHLDELRKRLIFVAVVILIATGICFTFAEQVLNILTRPAQGMELIYTSPAEAFMAQIRLAFITGVMFTLPFTFYQIMAFILPALREAEKKAVIPMVVVMFFLFALGIVFGYTVVFPFALYFFLGFSREGLLPLFTISSYISFTVSFLVAFGVVFEVPLVFWFLGRLSLVSSFFLKKNRKYALLVVAVLSAVITPPDIFSQILMIGPLMLLYEVGIMLVRLTERKRARLERAEQL